MKTFNYSPSHLKHLIHFVSRGVWLVFLLSSAAWAQNESTEKENLLPSGGPIHITAEKLISSTNNNNAEFIGNVKVTQGETRIDADRLQIFFTSSSESESKSTEQSLEKMIASGHVKIKVDNKLAVANKAVYITKNRLFTLTGPGAKITSGEHTITGETITFYRDEGKFTVDGGTDGRVEAVILPNQSGME